MARRKIYRKYRTRGPRKRRRKNPRTYGGNTFVIKAGKGKLGLLLLVALLGGGAALYFFRDKLPFKIPFLPGSNGKAAEIRAKMQETKALMADALEADDHITYRALKRAYEILELELDSLSL